MYFESNKDSILFCFTFVHPKPADSCRSEAENGQKQMETPQFLLSMSFYLTFLGYTQVFAHCSCHGERAV